MTDGPCGERYATIGHVCGELVLRASVPSVHATSESRVAVIRRILLCILLIGLAGLAAELLLLKHDENATQLIPLVLIGAAFAAIAWDAARGGAASLLALQLTMVLFVVAGPLGMYLHFRANVEFQREVDPSIAGRALFWKAMTAKTPPALAPGAMAQLGLIGLAYSYRPRTRYTPLPPATAGAQRRS